MKHTKIAIPAALMIFVHTLSAQTPQLAGSWQLVKQATCMDEAPRASEDENMENLREEMRSRTPVTAQVVSFRDNATGRESTRILNSDRTANPKKFYYKFNGKMLLILDKRSQTISDSYLVDKFTADSLILSNSARPCEIRIFVRLSDSK